jgi:nitroreductase
MSADLSDLVRQRRSAYAFDPRPVSDADLRAVFDVARHAPSSFNEQPWRYVVGRRGDAAYAAVLDALAGRNPTWAGAAPVLGLVLAAPAFEGNGRANRHAWHDVGASTAVLGLAAEARGLSLHLMAGVDGRAAAEALGVPSALEPVAAFALGRPAAEPGAGLPDALARRDRQRKPRRPLDQTVFGPAWGEALWPGGG